MSAITGIINFNQDPVDIAHGDKLLKALQKYPADYVDTWYKENIFLGCHAQFITPESLDERLPYYDPERQLAITADAIIDNRLELFDLLQVEYGQRKKVSDSELILLAYRKWGEEAPKYLIGDFAFMIWDERKQRLFGARDFSGSRTLYFHHNNERFIFCTIIKPLLSMPYIEKILNEQWLAEFLAIPDMFETVDTSTTVYKHIEQLPPSHTISVKGSEIVITRYCTLTAGKKLQLKSNQEYEEAFREVFQTAVSSRLHTHRDVGAYLSGGLDSGSVVSFAARALSKENKRLKTFSYVPVNDFVDWTSKRKMADERPFIESTVVHVGNISDHYLDFQGKNSLSEVNDWLDVLEMPYKFFENSFWLKGIYEKAQEQAIGILLNGSRGNYTVSWGPAVDYYAILLKKMKWIRLYQELCQYSSNIGIKKLQILSVIGKKAFPYLDRSFSSKEPNLFPELINPQFAKRTNVYEKLHEYGIDITGSSVPNAFEIRKKQFEPLFYWNTNGTSKAKLSLRYSLWDRDPTNDIRVIRFILSVPNEQFVHNGLDRALIRRSMKNLLPDKVRLNQRVRGIQGADGIHRLIPYWNTFIEELQLLSTDSGVSDLLNIQVIKNAISKVQKGPKLEYVLDPEFKILMRSLIVYRFIKSF